MLWTKDRTLFSRYFPQNLASIKHRLAKLTNRKTCLGGKLVSNCDFVIFSIASHCNFNHKIDFFSKVPILECEAPNSALI
jgi:hypothetical protein